jgi:hypothetical protein
MKRVASGYYTEVVSTTLDGETVSGLAEIVKVEGQNFWFIRLECDSKMFMEGDDWMSSKKDAIEVLKDVCEIGFEKSKFGICVKN